MECDLMGTSSSDGPEPSLPATPDGVQGSLGGTRADGLVGLGEHHFHGAIPSVAADLPISRRTSIVCLHRHLSVVRISLFNLGQEHSLEVVCMEQLPYLVLLGRDVPEFEQLLRKAVERLRSSQWRKKILRMDS